MYCVRRSGAPGGRGRVSPPSPPAPQAPPCGLHPEERLIHRGPNEGSGRQTRGPNAVLYKPLCPRCCVPQARTPRALPNRKTTWALSFGASHLVSL